MHAVVHDALSEFCDAVGAPAPPAGAMSERDIGDWSSRLQAETIKVGYIAKMHGLHLAIAESRVIRLVAVTGAHAAACGRLRTTLALPASMPPRLHRCRTEAEAKRILAGAIAEALSELPADPPAALAGRPSRSARRHLIADRNHDATILETEQEAQRLKTEAKAIAEGIEAAGAEPEASEAAKTAAAAARQIVEHAELRATLTPITEANRRKRELAQFEDDETEAIEAADATDEAVQAALARLERHREGFDLWMTQHRRDAWQAAIPRWWSWSARSSWRMTARPRLQPHVAAALGASRGDDGRVGSRCADSRRQRVGGIGRGAARPGASRGP